MNPEKGDGLVAIEPEDPEERAEECNHQLCSHFTRNAMVILDLYEATKNKTDKLRLSRMSGMNNGSRLDMACICGEETTL